MRPCRNCGTPIENSAEFCDECAKLDIPTEAERVENQQQKNKRNQRIANGKQVAHRRKTQAAEQEWVARILRVVCVPFLVIATLVGFQFGLDKFFLATLVESALVLAWFGLLNFHIEILGIGTSTNVGAKPVLIAFAVMWVSSMAFAILLASRSSERASTEPSGQTPIFPQFHDAV
mgnify:CR=1 FL=1